MNLLVAAREGRASDVVRLLRQQVDVNHTDAANGFTALHWAAACGQLEVVAVLLDLATALDVNRADKVRLSDFRLPATVEIRGSPRHRPREDGLAPLVVRRWVTLRCWWRCRTCRRKRRWR